jgi:hypothetical protein
LSRRELAVHRLSPYKCGLPLSEHSPNWGLPRVDWNYSQPHFYLFRLNKAKIRLRNTRKILSKITDYFTI